MEQSGAVETTNKATGWFHTVRDFLLNVRAEMEKVAWPTGQELRDATRRVLIMTVTIGTAIGILDFILQKVFVDGVAALAR